MHLAEHSLMTIILCKIIMDSSSTEVISVFSDYFQVILMDGKQQRVIGKFRGTGQHTAKVTLFSSTPIFYTLYLKYIRDVA